MIHQKTKKKKRVLFDLRQKRDGCGAETVQPGSRTNTTFDIGFIRPGI